MTKNTRWGINCVCLVSAANLRKQLVSLKLDLKNSPKPNLASQPQFQVNIWIITCPPLKALGDKNHIWVGTLPGDGAPYITASCLTPVAPPGVSLVNDAVLAKGFGVSCFPIL